MIPRDNDTRWNSWLTMLESAIDLESSIRVFIDKNYANLHKNQLSTDEWETIRETIAILKPFKDATKSMEGDQTTFDEVLQSMDFLIDHIKSKQEEHAFDPNLSASLLTMWFAFDKYYNLTDQTPAYAAALLLNPTLRKEYLDDHWKPLELRNKGTIERAIASARRLWQKEYKYRSIDGDENQPIDPDLITNTYLRWKYLDQLKRASVEDEFERFITVSAPSFPDVIYSNYLAGKASTINSHILP